MAEEIDLEKYNFQNFRSPVSDLDLGSGRGHTVCISVRGLPTHQISTKSEKLCGWIDGRKYVHMDGQMDGHARIQ